MKEKIELLDRQFPLEWEILHNPFNVRFMHNRLLNPEEQIECKLTFNIPPNEDLITQVALMYYQFDKYMKDKYGQIIEEYQQAQRTNRIENTR